MLTWSGRILAAIGVLLVLAGALMNYPEFVSLGLACLIAVLAAVAYLLIRPSVVAGREIRPARVAEGGSAHGVLTLTNQSTRRSPRMFAVEQMAGRPIVVPVASQARGASSTTSYPLPTDRRGVFDVGPLTIGRTDPLRLLNSTKTVAPKGKLTVYPRIHLVSPLPSGSARDLDGPTTSSAPRGGVAFHQISEYRPGDDPRLIHWRSTARTGVLMVRHNVVPNEPRLMVLLDTSHDAYTDATFEDAVRVAASMCMAACRAGHPLLFRTTGGLISSSERGLTDRDAVLDVLAAVERRPDDPGLPIIAKMVPNQDGFSIGVVTGQPAEQARAAVEAVAPRFQTISLVEIGEQSGSAGGGHRGVIGIRVANSAEFAAAWNKRIRS